MAMRSIAEIYNILAEEKAKYYNLDDFVNSQQSSLDNADLLLKDINSGSKVATWRLWLWIVAFASWLVESLFEVHKNEIEAIMSAKVPHTLRWYAEESKKFQYGYSMVWDGYCYAYETIDTDAQIIKYAAASQSGGTINLKVAKKDESGLIPLTAEEKAAFETFWNYWRDAGVNIEVISMPADLLKIDMTIVRDRLVLNSNNQLLRDTNIYPIDDAIDNFISNLEFNGILRLSELAAAIKAAEGVVDVKINSAQWKPSTATEYTNIDMEIIPDSGYFKIDVSSTITYTDYINVAIQTD